MAGFITGAGYLLKGFKMLNQPGLRRFVAVPLALNILLFGGLIWLGFGWIDQTVESMLSWIPGWLSFLSWVIWPLLFLSLMIFVFYSFSMVANLIASPFNGLLSERVERKLSQALIPHSPTHFPAHSPSDATAQNASAANQSATITAVLASVPHSLGREASKLSYFIPRALLLLVLSMIPGVNIIAMPLWYLFSAWFLAIQYCDYPTDNHNISVPELRKLLAQRRLSSMGFGSVTLLFTMIPFINLMVIPAAVIGATMFWMGELEELAAR